MSANFFSHPAKVLSRRDFISATAVGWASMPAVSASCAASRAPFRLRYLLASALYGKLPLEVVLEEVSASGSEALDIWGMPHADHREQVDAMGVEAFHDLMRQHRVPLAVSTRYPLGPFGLAQELGFVRELDGRLVVCGTTPSPERTGAQAVSAVRAFLERMKPHVARAEEAGVTIALENHENQLLCHPDTLRAFADLNPSSHLKIALAPHHMRAFVEEIPKWIRALDNRHMALLYLQEHHEGIRRQVPKEDEMKQLPGFGGSLDYRPVVQALRDIEYSGYVEIFMHPTPRGVPILPTAKEVTAAIRKSRDHMESCLRATV